MGRTPKERAESVSWSFLQFSERLFDFLHVRRARRLIVVLQAIKIGEQLDDGFALHALRRRHTKSVLVLELTMENFIMLGNTPLSVTRASGGTHSSCTVTQT